MLTIEETRKILSKDIPDIESFTDREIGQLRDQMYSFWSMMLEGEGL